MGKESSQGQRSAYMYRMILSIVLICILKTDDKERTPICLWLMVDEKETSLICLMKYNGRQSSPMNKVPMVGRVTYEFMKII